MTSHTQTWTRTNGWSRTDPFDSDNEIEKSHPVDLISFLAAAQANNVELLPVNSQPALPSLGRGLSAMVSQSRVQHDLSLAFKSSDQKKKSRSRKVCLQELTTEMCIYKLPAVQGHPNIVQLEGIGFDIDQVTKEYWPVFILMKSSCGTLNDFLQSGNGERLNHSQRLDVCEAIGSGLAALHNSGVIHGDVKPENVLIFEPYSGKPTFKPSISDFGCSTIAFSAYDPVPVADSPPWTALDRNARGDFLERAKAMDAYSYALVCVWVLFQGILFHGKDYKEQKSELDVLKRSGRLPLIVQETVEDLMLPKEEKSQLVEFFRLNLAPKAEDRITNGRFMFLGGVHSSPTKFMENKVLEHPLFSLRKSIMDLSLVNFRFREEVFSSLKASLSSSCPTCPKNSALQLALCYYLAFGTEESNECSEELQNQYGISASEIEFELKLMRDLKSTEDSNNATQFLEADLLHSYQTRNDLSPAIEVYEREIGARKRHLGHIHQLVYDLQFTLATLYEACGRLDDAERTISEVYQNRQKHQGLDDLETLAAMNQLVRIQAAAGKVDCSMSLGKTLVSQSEDLLGPKNKFTLSAKVHLAIAYYELGWYDQAVTLLIDTISSMVDIFGPDNQNTTAAMHNLSMCYLMKVPPELEKAEKLMETIEKLYEDNLEEDHRLVLGGKRQLALFKRKSNHPLEIVLKMQKDILEKSLHFLGRTDPDTWIDQTNYALSLIEGKELEEGTDLLEEAIINLRTLLGKNHPIPIQIYGKFSQRLIENHFFEEADALLRGKGFKEMTVHQHMQILVEMANAYNNLGDYVQAENLWKKSVKVAEVSGESSHLTTHKALACLAELQFNQNRYKEAEGTFSQILSLFRDDPRINTSDILRVCHELGHCYRNQGRFSEAVRVHRELCEECETKLGLTHDITLSNKGSLSLALRETGNREAALFHEKQLLETRREVLGDAHLDTVLSMSCIAKDLLALEQYEDAAKMLREVIDKYSKTLGPTNALTLDAIGALAVVFHGQKKLHEALELQQRNLDIFTAMEGAKTIDIAHTQYCLADILNDLGEHKRAEMYARNALRLWKDSCGNSHYYTVRSFGLLGEILMEQGLFEDSLSMFREEEKMASSMDKAVRDGALSLARSHIKKLQERHLETSTEGLSL